MGAGPQIAITPESARSIRDYMVEAIKAEFPVTKRVLQNLNEGDWKPDPKARPAKDLAWHIVTSDVWFLNGIADGAFSTDAPPTAPESIGKMIEWYEQQYPAAMGRVEQLTPEQLTAMVDFFGMKMPNLQFLTFALVHAVHHRGQLATYLRPLGGKVPDIYGGSADEPWQGAPAA